MAVERIEPPASPHLPPHNLEAEQSVLGAMLVNPNAITAVAEVLTADDFYRDTHRLIFRGAITLFERGEEVDVVTISAQLEREGMLERAGGRDFVHGWPSSCRPRPTPRTTRASCASRASCGRSSAWATRSPSSAISTRAIPATCWTAASRRCSPSSSSAASPSSSTSSRCWSATSSTWPPWTASAASRASPPGSRASTGSPAGSRRPTSSSWPHAPASARRASRSTSRSTSPRKASRPEAASARSPSSAWR